MDPFSRQKPGQCEPRPQNQVPGSQQDEQGEGITQNGIFDWLTNALGQQSEEEQSSTSVTSMSSLTSAVAHHYSTPASITTDATNSTLYSQQEQIIQSETASVPYNMATAAAGDVQFRLEALDESWQLFLSILYSLTAITSFLLNVITVIVLARCGRSELRKYLINLSMSDLLMSLLSIPFTYTEYMLGRWIFSSFLCPVVRFVVTLSVFVSAATMTVIGINRHLAIIYPFRKKKCSRLRRWTSRKSHVIVAIWLVGIVISTPDYLMWRVEPFCYEGQIYSECHQLWPDKISRPYAIFIYLFTFAIPLCLLCYLYSCIGLKLWRRQMPGNVDANRDLTMQMMRLKEQVIKMLFVVVIVFAVFWLPLQTFSMVLFLYPELRENIAFNSLGYNIFVCTYFFCHWLSMAHSCLNPLIYCFMNDKFRSDLQALICKRDKYFARRLQLTNQQSSQAQLFGQLTSGHHSQVAGAISLPSSSLNGANNFAPPEPDGATVPIRNNNRQADLQQKDEDALEVVTTISGVDQQPRAAATQIEAGKNNEQALEMFVKDLSSPFGIDKKRQVGETTFLKVCSQQSGGDRQLVVYDSALNATTYGPKSAGDQGKGPTRPSGIVEV